MRFLQEDVTMVVGVSIFKVFARVSSGSNHKLLLWLMTMGDIVTIYVGRASLSACVCLEWFWIELL